MIRTLPKVQPMRSLPSVTTSWDAANCSATGTYRLNMEDNTCDIKARVTLTGAPPAATQLFVVGLLPPGYMWDDALADNTAAYQFLISLRDSNRSFLAPGAIQLQDSTTGNVQPLWIDVDSTDFFVNDRNAITSVLPWTWAADDWIQFAMTIPVRRRS